MVLLPEVRPPIRHRTGQRAVTPPLPQLRDTKCGTQLQHPVGRGVRTPGQGLPGLLLGLGKLLQSEEDLGSGQAECQEVLLGQGGHLDADRLGGLDNLLGGGRLALAEQRPGQVEAQLEPEPVRTARLRHRLPQQALGLGVANP
ncbi:hypothetical protein [Kitasatospora griseola]